MLLRFLKKKLEKISTPEKISSWPKRNFPLSLHRGAIVRFDQIPFILGSDQMEIPGPYDGDWYVMAVGELEIYGVSFLRFYLENDKEEESILQITNIESPEICFMKVAYEFFPQTFEDVDEWMNKERGLIGNFDINTPKGNTYLRVFNHPGPDHINPIDFLEIIYTDESIERVKNEGMFYHRTIVFPEGAGNVTESLFATKHTDSEGSMIRIYVGINLPIPAITVI